jgi:flagellar motility protein MotE (MotC chaperone)
VIVTRQRRKPFPFRRLILPLLAIALIVFAFLWPPSRNVMLAGPMSPAVRTVGSWFDAAATPFHFAAQNQTITDLNRQVVALQGQLSAAQSTAGDKDKQIADLQQQINQLQTQAAATRSAPAPAKGAPQPSPSAGSFSNDLGAGATADVTRTAQYWTSMDPENAAKIAQRLPPGYVARVFAQMQPDAVGAILDALPATFAAKLTQEHPQLQR